MKGLFQAYVNNNDAHREKVSMAWMAEKNLKLKAYIRKTVLMVEPIELWDTQGDKNPRKTIRVHKTTETDREGIVVETSLGMRNLH